MVELLKALRGSRLIAMGMVDGRKVCHYLMSNGNVLEVIL